MSLGYGAKITTDGLVFAFDAGNPKVSRPLSNQTSEYEWHLTTGSESFWGMNGSTAENRRITGTNPFGQQDIIWDEPSNDTTSDGDGGWSSAQFPVDQNKMYRFSVWVKRPIIGNGSTYLGTYGYNSSGTNIGVRWLTSTSTTTNPYGTARAWWGNADQWYLVVFHVHAYGTPVMSTAHIDSGIWDTSGNKVVNENTDMVWLNGTTKAVHRSYLYYSTSSTTRQQWYAPRVDVIDGTEPSLKDLLTRTHNEKDLVGGMNINNYGAVKDVNNGKFEVSTSAYVTATVPETIKNLTYESVIEWNSLNNDFFSLGHGNVGSGGTYIQSYAYSDGITIGVYNASGWHTSSKFSYSFEAGKKYYISMSNNESTWYCYVNGELIGSQNLNNIPSGASTSLGMNRNHIQNNSQGNGKVYLSRLYHKSLSSNEIKNNFEVGRRRYGL